MNQVLMVFVIGALFSLAHSLQAMEDIPVNINRRIGGDVYHLYPESGQRHSTCSEGKNTTYVVAERRCINDQHLFNECSFLLTPMGELSISRLSIFFMNDSETNETLVGYTFREMHGMEKAIVSARQGSTTQPVNSSRCQIASLEVYRGREQAISISCNGFSLSNSSTLIVNVTELMYDPLDFCGELYRMNISCYEADSGCMFFKILGTSNITDGKFNCIVPGTLFNNTTKCDSSTTGSNGTTSSMLVTSNSNTASGSEPPAKDNPFRFEVGSPLFYGVIGIGSVIIAVMLCLMVVCVSLCHKRRCKYKNLQTRRMTAVDQTGQHKYEDVHDSCTCAGRTTNSDSNSDISERKLKVNTKNYSEETFDTPVYAESGAVYKEKVKHSKEHKEPERRVENPHYARGNIIKKPIAQEPTEVYSTLVQVGGRKLCDHTDTEVTNNQYAELHEGYKH